MDPVTAAALIGAGTSIFGSIFGSKSQSNTNVKMWQMQNEYNEPKNQVQRIRDAGFNPAHLFGQVNLDSGAAEMPASPDIASMIGSTSSALGGVVNAGLAAAQKRKLEAEAKKSEIDADYTEQMKLAQQLRNDFLPQMLDNEVSLQDLEKRLKESNLGLNDATISQITAETENLRKKSAIMDKEIAMYVETLRKAKSEADIQELQAKATPEFIRKQFEQYNSNIRLTNEQAQQASAMIRSINKDTDIKEFERQIKEVAADFAYDNEFNNLQQNRYNTESAYMDIRAKRSGRPVREFVAPVGEITGAFGRLLGGLAK